MTTGFFEPGDAKPTGDVLGRHRPVPRVLPCTGTCSPDFDRSSASPHLSAPLFTLCSPTVARSPQDMPVGGCPALASFRGHPKEGFLWAALADPRGGLACGAAAASCDAPGPPPAAGLSRRHRGPREGMPARASTIPPPLSCVNCYYRG